MKFHIEFNCDSKIYILQVAKNVNSYHGYDNEQGPSYLGLTSVVSVLVADALAPFIARTSAAMILTINIE